MRTIGTVKGCSTNEHPFRIFKFIASNDPINDLINDSIKGLSDAIGKSPATVQRDLKHLTELDLIRRDGSNKMGQWVAVK